MNHNKICPNCEKKRNNNLLVYSIAMRYKLETGYWISAALKISTDYQLLGKVTGDDQTLLSTKVSELTPNQYRHLEDIVSSFIAAVTERLNLPCLLVRYSEMPTYFTKSIILLFKKGYVMLMMSKIFYQKLGALHPGGFLFRIMHDCILRNGIVVYLAGPCRSAIFFV